MDPVRSATGGIRVSDDLVAQIVAALAESGEYVARVELMPTQGLVDFHWAALRAGRRLGLQVGIDVRLPKNDPDPRAEVRVGPRRVRPT